MQANLLDLIPDITISRHRGSAESIAANPSAESKRESHSRILALYANDRCLTAKEVADYLNVPIHKVSGRLAEMKALNLLMKTSVRRDGSAELKRV